MKSNNIKSALAGAVTGAANGFFGAGGGMLLVPALTRILKLEQKRAFATSVCIILPLCAASAVTYFIRAQIPFMEALPYLAGGLIGGFISGKLLGRIPVNILRRVFGAFIIYGGIRALL